MWETLRYHITVMRPAPTLLVIQHMFCPLHDAATVVDNLSIVVDREAIDEEMEADPTVLVMGAPALGQFAVTACCQTDAYDSSGEKCQCI